MCEFHGKSFPLFPVDCPARRALALRRRCPRVPTTRACGRACPKGSRPPTRACAKRFCLGRVRAEGERLGRPPARARPRLWQRRTSPPRSRAVEPRSWGVDVAEEPLRRARVAPSRPRPAPRRTRSAAALGGRELRHGVGRRDDRARRPTRRQWLSEVRRVLRSGGLVLLSTPDHGPLSRLRLGSERARVRGPLRSALGPSALLYPPVLLELLADFGFEEVAVEGAWGLPGARRVLLASGAPERASERRGWWRRAQRLAHRRSGSRPTRGPGTRQRAARPRRPAGWRSCRTARASATSAGWRAAAEPPSAGSRAQARSRRWRAPRQKGEQRLC